MKFFLGVDGGQTTTKVVVGDEKGELLAYAIGGPSNHTEEPGGPERLEKIIRSALEHALGAVGIHSLAEADFAAACFGMTGEIDIKRRVLARIVRTPHLTVVHDSVNALAGATAGMPGLIVISGTGCVARGRNAEGRELRVGGWGHLFGDEGSAYWIGREAVRAVAGELDLVGQKTLLTGMLLSRLSVTSAYEIMAKYYSGAWSREHLAGLSRWVDEAAQAGDSISVSIMRAAGKHLGQLALGILSFIFEKPQPRSGHARASSGTLVCYTGEVFQSEFVMAGFKETILEGCPQALIRPALLQPVLGSLILAYQDAGVEVSNEVSSKWSESLIELKTPPKRDE